MIFKFDGKSQFTTWKTLMLAFLKGIDIWSIIERELINPLDTWKSLDDQKKVLNHNHLKNNQTLRYIFQSVEFSMLDKIYKSTSTKSAYYILCNAYGKNKL